MENTQDRQPTRPTIVTGGIFGGILMAAVLGLSYLGSRAAELPSVPDNIFAWIRDLLPGEVITNGIDFMVDTIITFDLGSSVDSTAKFMEQLSAIGMVLGIGIALGAALFFALRSQAQYSSGSVYLASGATGLLTGVIVALISQEKMIITNLLEPETFSLLDGLWLVLLFVMYGLGLGWIYNSLVELPLRADTSEKASVKTLDRRRFLVQVGGASAVLTVVGAGLGRLLREDTPGTTTASSAETDVETISTGGESVSGLPDDLPNAEAVVQPAPGTRPEYTPLDEHYRIDISTRPPRIRETEWALLISGLVEQDTVLTLSDLRSNYESLDQYITLSCISNRLGGDLISTTRWTGVPVRDLLTDWNIRPEAQWMRITAADGFDEYVSLDLCREDGRIMLAYEWDGQPLKEKHGFPLRIYIPDHYGMKQPKWIIGIEMVEEWDEGYWVRRGWSDTAKVRTVSVVDTVATDAIYEENGQRLIPIGGIAYSGARGISKVEVSIDDGEWTEAVLRDPISPTTWVLWRYDWAFNPGEHTVRVRAYDGSGSLQTLDRNDVRPNGATGIHSVSGTIEA